MDNLINSHDLKEIVVGYEKSKVITDILKYQNQFVKFSTTKSKDRLIISIPEYNKTIDNLYSNKEIIHSYGVVLILDKDQKSGKYLLVKELFSNTDNNFENFGKILEISNNDNYIIVSNKETDVYIYDIEGNLLQKEKNIKEQLNSIENKNHTTNFFIVLNKDINKFIITTSLTICDDIPNADRDKLDMFVVTVTFLENEIVDIKDILY